MKTFRALLVCIFLHTLPGSWNPVYGTPAAPPKCKASLIYESIPDHGLEIVCENVGSDGRSFDEVLNSEPNLYENQSFSGIEARVKEINCRKIKGDVIVKNNSLAVAQNLEHLSFNALIETTPAVGSDPKKQLVISATELKNLPKLKEFYAMDFYLANSTIEALKSVKEKINILGFRFSTPAQTLLEMAGDFPNLEIIQLVGICYNRTFPLSTLRKSVKTLRSIRVTCPLPVLTSDMFKGMASLKALMWTDSGITAVEEGAFDDLVNLAELNLSNNSITWLPDGIFKKNKKLKYAVLSSNDIQNLSRDNFTHVHNFRDFQFIQ